MAKSFSLFAGVDYITTAQIFLNPNTSDIILKNKSFEITNLYSPVIDFRYRINDDLILGISSEYISKSQKGRNLLVNEGSQQLALEVDDGVEFIPIEISAYYFLPFSTNQFKFTMVPERILFWQCKQEYSVIQRLKKSAAKPLWVSLFRWEWNIYYLKI